MVDMWMDPDLERAPFSAAHVAYAAGCSEDAIANYIFKNHLYLCSDAPGRGKRRKYPLIDVLQLALMAALVSLSRDAEGSARICDDSLFMAIDQLFVEAEAQGREPTRVEISEEYARLATEYKNDRGKAPRPYNELDLDHPWILSFEISEEGWALNPEWIKWGEHRIWSTPDVSQGCYLNVTKRFVDALNRLSHSVRKAAQPE